MDHVVATFLGNPELWFPRRKFSQIFGQDGLTLNAIKWQRLFIFSDLQFRVNNEISFSSNILAATINYDMLNHVLIIKTLNYYLKIISFNYWNNELFSEKFNNFASSVR